MSNFRETFTKEDKKDSVLDYDDSAFLFFGGTILLVVLVPFTLKFVRSLTRNDDNLKYSSSKKTQKHCKCEKCVQRETKFPYRSSFFDINWRVWLKGITLVVLWAIFLRLVYLCSLCKQLATFDPFEILGISPGSDDRQIKKAYRLMSLKLHPDKNPNDPTASAKFVMLSKAYQSLTDEIAKKNYEKYGNPDGPGSMKVGIGLPHFLVDEKYQLFNLLIFFTVVLIIVPMIVILYYKKQQRYAPNGVQIETLSFLMYSMNEGTRMKHAPELLASSGESRELTMRPTDDKELNVLKCEITEPRKRQHNNPTIVRNYFLILGHLERLHDLFSPNQLEDLSKILETSDNVISSMIEISIRGNWFLSVQSMIDFKRSMFHGLGFRGIPNLQIPYFTEEIQKKSSKNKPVSKDIRSMVNLTTQDIKEMTGFDDLKAADVVAFLKALPDVSFEARIYVDDEDEMVIGDAATVEAKLTRNNLTESEVCGPIHAPLLPGLKYEEWWFILVDTTGSLVEFERSPCLDKVIEVKLQIRLRKAGRNELIIHAVCDSYAGVDCKMDLKFDVKTEQQVNRVAFVHPEDQALDNQPSLFQHMINQIHTAEDDSSDEEGAAEEQVETVEEVVTEVFD